MKKRTKRRANSPWESKITIVKPGTAIVKPGPTIVKPGPTIVKLGPTIVKPGPTIVMTLKIYPRPNWIFRFLTN